VKLHELHPKPGSNKKPKRLGCGRGSGHGKTSTRGQKGQRARSGSGKRPGFEGGQMPLFRRIPKRGFKSFNQKKFFLLNIDDLDSGFDDGAAVNGKSLFEKGLIPDEREAVKILGGGELKKKLFCQVQAFSQKARAKIEKAGGEIKCI
jgi:large subunit ribosomal protein L15